MIMSVNGTGFELPARPLGDAGVPDVFPHRLALFGEIRVGLTLGLDRDRSTVVRGADAAREESAVVIGVVPGKPALVAGVMPEADRELDRLDRLPAVERHGLAVGLDLPDITSVWNRSQLLSGATQTI